MLVAADHQAIHAATETLRNAVNRADVAGILSVWSDGGVLMPPHHPAVVGRAALETYFRQLFEQSRFHFVFTGSDLTIESNTAIERITYTVEATPLGSSILMTDRGKGLHVYQRAHADDGWKLMFDVWNSDNPRV